MALVSLGALLAPISAEEPSGPNLEYDPEFAKLERIALGKPEQMMGASLVPGEDPDWKTMSRDSQALLGRTKDLRVAVHLAKSLLRVGGLAGFGEGLAVLRGLIDGYWDTVHPRLDPEDDNDPTMRMNALAALVDGPTLAAVRTTPLVLSRAVGKFSLRDIAVATGEVPPGKDENPPTAASIEGAFDSIEADALAATAAAAKSALEDVGLIEALVTDRVGGARAVNLSKLSDLLATANKHLSAATSRRAALVPIATDTGNGASPTDTGGADPTAATGAAPRRSGMPGEINTREDVVRALEQIVAYYQRHEPTSPVPLVVKRAKRMVGMSFLEIIKDVVPDAASQAELLRGHSDPGEGS
jgi:type VI secretion system protein ImpA